MRTAILGAGIDPYALGVATGAMLIVLRTGETDRKLAQAKLEVLDRMPVRILGTVLNDIGENPQFKYYYYLEGYGALETADDPSALIGSGNGASGRRSHPRVATRSTGSCATRGWPSTPPAMSGS